MLHSSSWLKYNIKNSCFFLGISIFFSWTEIKCLECHIRSRFGKIFSTANCLKQWCLNHFNKKAITVLKGAVGVLKYAALCYLCIETHLLQLLNYYIQVNSSCESIDDCKRSDLAQLLSTFLCSLHLMTFLEIWRFIQVTENPVNCVGRGQEIWTLNYMLHFRLHGNF